MANYEIEGIIVWMLGGWFNCQNRCCLAKRICHTHCLANWGWERGREREREPYDGVSRVSHHPSTNADMKRSVHLHTYWVKREHMKWINANRKAEIKVQDTQIFLNEWCEGWTRQSIVNMLIVNQRKKMWSHNSRYMPKHTSREMEGKTSKHTI